MALMELRSVTKEYSLGQLTVAALREVDLTIDAGEFVGIWGPSGSGKTTLLNILGLIDEPTRGLYRFDGVDTAQLSDDAKCEMRNHRLGFIFQHFNLIPVLSALENVMIPLQIMGRPAGEAAQRARERLEQLGLTAFVHQRPDKLSGGQQQRVAIARALVTHPLVVIADEPTANLDSQTAKSIVGLMRLLNREEGTTFVFSTHDQRLLDAVDRLIRLEDGCIRLGERGDGGVV
uniref:ABC transporter ATP-binding protein n=1 Tax=Desulfacinum infernum TaxID=35837 RepID=A0A831ZTV3_9BACT